MTPPDEPARIQTGEHAGRGRRWPRSWAVAPAPLVALELAVAILGITWALLVPPFQAPDEISHFAYAQSLASRFALPGNPSRPLASSDQSLGDVAVGASVLAFHTASVRPNWNAGDFSRYLKQARQHPSQSDGGGPNQQAVNPPLFYLYSDLAYWASGSYNLFGRLYAMRLWGVVLLLATVAAAWLLAGEVFGRRRLGQFTCAALSGLVPMETFMSTSINPDGLMVPLWTLALWLGSRLIRRGWRTADAVALCAVTAAAILTKATSYALLPAVLLALVLAWRWRPVKDRVTWLAPAAVLATLAVPVLGWVVLDRALGRSAINSVGTPSGARAQPFSIPQFVSYLWEFYLPKLPLMGEIRVTPGIAAYYVWLREGWAVFGWREVFLAGWVYKLLTVLTAAVAAGAAALLIRLRGGRRLALLAFFALALVALLFGLHLTEYRSLIAGEGALLQGRYLLPVIGLFGLCVALIVLRIPERWRGMSAGAFVAGMLLLQVLSLATIAKVYYT
ncbi:MAG: DUF2142 domain-containing protein [Solirubrobacteraceae bacterium]